MNVRDRVIGLRRVKSSDLRPNPRNWREHPDSQRSALRGLLGEVGIADCLIAFESKRAGGALTLIDGHLRRNEEPDIEWPVLVLDLNDDEADKVLSTLDPLAGMATTNVATLTELLDDIEARRPDVKNLLAEIAKNEGVEVPDFEPVGIDAQSRLDEKSKIQCPRCGNEFER